MDLTKINTEKPDIIIKKSDLTTEVRKWLKENLDGRYVIRPNKVRYKFGGPSVKLKDCLRLEGYKMFFESDEDIMAFKLRWL